MIKCGPSSNMGFTLLEVLIALVILSIGLLAVAHMSIYTIRSNALGNKITKAAVLAEGKLEDLNNVYRIDPTNTMLTDDGDKSDIGVDVHSNTVLFTNPDHSDSCNCNCSVSIGQIPQRVWNVADDTPAPGIKTVTVIVGWKDSIDHFVVLSTAMRR